MYKIKTSNYLGQQITNIIKTNDDGSFICMLPDPANTDYQAYLKWLAEGNAAIPADNEVNNDNPI